MMRATTRSVNLFLPPPLGRIRSWRLPDMQRRAILLAGVDSSHSPCSPPENYPFSDESRSLLRRHQTESAVAFGKPPQKASRDPNHRRQQYSSLSCKHAEDSSLLPYCEGMIGIGKGGRRSVISSSAPWRPMSYNHHQQTRKLQRHPERARRFFSSSSSVSNEGDGVAPQPPRGSIARRKRRSPSKRSPRRRRKPTEEKEDSKQCGGDANDGASLLALAAAWTEPSVRASETPELQEIFRRRRQGELRGGIGGATGEEEEIGDGLEIDADIGSNNRNSYSSDDDDGDGDGEGGYKSNSSSSDEDELQEGGGDDGDDYDDDDVLTASIEEPNDLLEKDDEDTVEEQMASSFSNKDNQQERQQQYQNQWWKSSSRKKDSATEEN